MASLHPCNIQPQKENLFTLIMSLVTTKPLSYVLPIQFHTRSLVIFRNLHLLITFEYMMFAYCNLLFLLHQELACSAMLYLTNND